MAKLTPGKALVQPEPLLLVENQLAPGRYRFELVVISSSGKKSAPAHVDVNIVARDRPIDPFRPI